MGQLSVMRYRDGETILEQGSFQKGMFKILSGSVALCTERGGKNYVTRLLSVPDCFGELTLLTGHPSLYAAVAQGETVVSFVSEDSFARFLRDEHQNMIGLMKTITQRLVQLEQFHIRIGELAETGGDTVSSAELKRLVRQYGWEELAAGELPVQDAPEEDELSEETGFFLPGHTGCPGIVHPEYRQYLFDKRYSCPHCGNVFRGARIFYAKLVPIQSDIHIERCDFRVFYQDFKPEWYEIVTYPHCYFSAYYDYFENPKYLAKARYENRLAVAYTRVNLDFEVERDLDFVFAQHYLALICADGFASSRQLKARVWDNLRWMYREVGNEALARTAEDRAVEAFKEVYSNSDLDLVQQQRICLIIADVMHQRGDREGAKTWAAKVRWTRHGNQRLSDMAKNIIDAIRADEEMEARAAAAAKRAEQAKNNQHHGLLGFRKNKT